MPSMFSLRSSGITSVAYTSPLSVSRDASSR